ncbi:VOC family protein [Sinomicrobium sp.]
MNQNIICWFEIYARDINRAKRFYKEVLGIHFIDAVPPGEATEKMKMAFFSSPQNQGVSGALIEMPGTKDGDGACVNTMVYFPCEDCSEQVAKVELAGGKVHRAKMNFGEYGYCSICVDSEGNPFGLFSMR